MERKFTGSCRVSLLAKSTLYQHELTHEQPDDALKPANVLSTLSAMALCAAGKPKTFTFISSTSVLDTDHYIQMSEGGTPVPESDDLEGSRKNLSTGYGQSKWVSEYLVRQAGKRGLKGTIVRPGYVTGDSVSGGQYVL